MDTLSTFDDTLILPLLASSKLYKKKLKMHKSLNGWKYIFINIFQG